MRASRARSAEDAAARSGAVVNCSASASPDDLAGGRAGDRGGGDLVRHLEPDSRSRQSASARAGVESVRSRDDEGDLHLAQHVVPPADDSGVGDVGTGQQYLFDLGRIDVLPPRMISSLTRPVTWRWPFAPSRPGPPRDDLSENAFAVASGRL